jgi:adenosylcobyric acid synthase
MPGRVLMVQGTMSSAGKSLLTAALCRILARRGIRVAPFKAQNMSNNAAVTPDGLEIGRAQATQAEAAGVELRAEMNPILIKPEADARAQVVVLGRPWKTLEAKRYYQYKQDLWPVVTQSLDRLREEFELIIIEGAGSAAEINLRAGDMVNMAVARYAQAPVLLVGNIDLGGIFAQLLGTLWLLEPEDRALVAGLIVNKFRGDLSLFADGVRLLEERGGVPVLGVIPYLHLLLPDEDAVAVEQTSQRTQAREGEIDIAVIRLPRISNFDDLDPLKAEPGVRVRYVAHQAEFGHPSAVILPGTKSTLGDLRWMLSQGLAEAVQHYAQAGGAVVGICGGYQMLGQTIADPDHVESPADRSEGLGLLPVETIFALDKATQRVRARVRSGPGWLASLEGETVAGYEIHMGRTTSGAAWLDIQERSGRPMDSPDGVLDGAVAFDGRVWGCYLHALFENESLRRAWLRSLGWQAGGRLAGYDRRKTLNELADHVEAALDMEKIMGLVAR